MGGSSYSDDHYRARSVDRVARGVSTFDYSAKVSSGAVARAVHDKLKPFGVTRESRDSAAHPESLAIGVMFDVTGSMGGVPKVLQEKIPQLMSLLLRKGYVEHPQVLMGAVGDAYSDQAPLQVGQFESGAEMDDDINNIWLEGNGGGQQKESYELALYFFARHTSIDCFEKRGRKGYLFLTGDEMPYPIVKASQVKSIIGDNLERDIPIADIVAELQQRYHVFFVIPGGASHSNQAWLKETWSQLLGAEHVLRVEDPAAICETIALSIGLCEGAVDLSGGAAHIRDAGGSTSIVASVTNALDPLAKKTALARVGTGNLPEKTGRSGANVRL